MNEPIFTEEVLTLFPEYSRVQVFRFLKEATTSKELIQFCRGVYFIPKMTCIGILSTIVPDDVIGKKYMSDGDRIYGVFAGLELLNAFSITTQVSAIIEIVTNNATLRYREIVIRGRTFILRKSRCEINKDNFAAYTIMQLFNDMLKRDRLYDSSLRILQDFVKTNGVSLAQLYALSSVFPAKAAKKFVSSGAIWNIRWAESPSSKAS